MNEHPLVIASAANERYASGLGVMMCSALLCAEARTVRFYIIDDGITEETKSRLTQQVDATAMVQGLQVQLNFMDFTPPVLPPLSPLNGSLTAYAVIFLPSLLDEKSVFYVDADIICNRRFPLLEDLTGQYPEALLIGCQDPIGILEGDCPWKDELDENECAFPYINTGFMCMNLAALRDFGLQKEFLRLAGMGKPMRFADQTALNFLCRGRIGLISPDFNHLWNKSEGLNPDAVCNIHFVGPVKPWHLELKASSLLQIALFNSTARCLGLSNATVTKWNERRISVGFLIGIYARIVFYQLTSNKRLTSARRQLTKWRLMKSYNEAHETRLRRAMKLPHVGDDDGRTLEAL